MTEQKPPGITWEHWTEELPGIGEPYDPDWGKLHDLSDVGGAARRTAARPEDRSA